MLEKELTVLQSIDTFLENIFRHIFFQFNTLKGTTKALAVDLLTLTTLRGIKTAFFNS